MHDPSPSSGTPSQPPDTRASADGSEVVYTSAKSCDPAGNCAVGTVALSIDTTPPRGDVVIGGGAAYVSSPIVSVAVQADDATSGIATVELSGDAVHWTRLPGPGPVEWSLVDPTTGGTPGAGSKTVHVRLTDRAGNVTESEQVIPFDPDRVSRLAGSDRFATAAAISRATFDPGVPVAYVATAFDFPDALAGAVAAARAGGPILLVRSTGLIDPATAAELQRLRPERIVVLGGTGVVSDASTSQLSAAVGQGAELPLSPAYFYSAPMTVPTVRDANGVAMVDYSWGPEYNPVTISQVALADYRDWLDSGSVSAWADFIRQTGWLVDHQLQDGRWLYTFAFGGQPVPWWSAMAEGQAISVMVRAYRATGDTRYATAAERALTTFGRLQSDAGVTSIDRGDRWYEEYMWPYSPHTLNGFMFALAGLWEYHQTFGDAQSASLVADGLHTLASNLSRFDTGRWSCYSLPDLTRCSLASTHYHTIHIAELRYYYALTGTTTFKTYADRWQADLTDHP